MYAVHLFDTYHGFFNEIIVCEDKTEAYNRAQDKFLKFPSIYANCTFCIENEKTKEVSFYDSWTNPTTMDSFCKRVNTRLNDLKPLPKRN